MKVNIYIFIIVMFFASLSWGQLHKLPSASEGEAICKQVVNRAIQIYKEKKATKGQKYALRLLNSRVAMQRMGAMIGTIYVYVMDYSTGHPIMKAHPVNSKLVGRDLWDLKDTRGNLFVRDMVEVAKSDVGRGWVSYWWKRHGETKGTFKRAFLKSIPDDKLVFGAGYYITDQSE